jgi:hypothetical protein
MVKRYGDDVMLDAAARTDKLLDQGDMTGCEVWHWILNAIERLQAKTPRLSYRASPLRHGGCDPHMPR